MSEMKKVLITTDLSELSERAFPAAAMVADCAGAEITLVTVVDFAPQLPPGALALLPAQERKLKNEILDKVTGQLDELVKKHLTEFASINCEILESSHTASAICDYASKGKYDLMVIATHGRSGVARLVLGSVADRVVREASIPVLMVPAR